MPGRLNTSYFPEDSDQQGDLRLDRQVGRAQFGLAFPERSFKDIRCRRQQQTALLDIGKGAYAPANEQRDQRKQYSRQYMERVSSSQGVVDAVTNGLKIELPMTLTHEMGKKWVRIV
jgi:hypothetical protein